MLLYRAALSVYSSQHSGSSLSGSDPATLLWTNTNIFLAGTLMTGLFLAMIHLRQSLSPSLQLMVIYSESW